MSKLKLNLQLFAEGEEDQEVAAPESEDTFDESNEHTEEVVETPDQSDEPPSEPPRDFEKDKAYADMRRKAEEAERRANAADKWVKDNFGHKGINTWAEYQAEVEHDRKREQYAEQGIDYDEVRKIAKEEAERHPDVIRAQAIKQREDVNSEIRSLKSAYPHLDVSEISDIGDLTSMLSKLPKWDDISSRLMKGYSLQDSYELANRDEIISQRAAAAAQAARNASKSKDHLKPSGTAVAEDALIIDPEEMKMFKSLMPKKTEAEIIAWKKKQRK